MRIRGLFIIQPKKIIHVPRRFAPDHWGGTESVILNLCRQGAARNAEPEIHTSRALCSRAEETWRGIPIRRYPYVYPFLGLSAEEKHALDLKGGNLVSLSLFSRLLLRTPGVRLFHAHVLKRMGGEILTVARLRRKPCIVTLHGNVFDVPPEEAAGIVEPQAGHFEWGKPLGFVFQSRNLLEKADAVICVGHSEFEAARRALAHDRVHYIPNGVDPARFAGGNGAAIREKQGIPPGASVIGCISRIDPQKNQLLLVRSLKRVRARNPETHLVIAGPCTQPGYREELERAARELELTRYVHLLPPVDTESETHKDLLAACDVFALPSRHEPFGIVVLEAWSAGKPVAASEVGGLRRLITDGEDGLFFPPGDETACAQALVRLSGSEQLRNRLAANGAKKVAAEYTWERIYQNHEKIYREAEDPYGVR